VAHGDPKSSLIQIQL